MKLANLIMNQSTLIMCPVEAAKPGVFAASAIGLAMGRAYIRLST